MRRAEPATELLLVRHAPAIDRKGGPPDALRPLTRDGARKMRKAARGLKRLVASLDALASSPLLRAVETARIIARAYGLKPVLELPELAPGASFEGLVAALRRRKAGGTVALVGHQPHLSRAADSLLTGGKGLRLRLKKGGACLIGFEGRPARGGGRLLWVATPGLLRRLS